MKTPYLPYILSIAGLLLLAAPVASAQTLLAQYKFDEGSGSVVADSSGNGINLSSSLSWTSDGQGVGGTGYAGYDHGTSINYGTAASNASTGTTFDGLTSYTVTGWIHMNAAQNGGRLLSIGGGDTTMQIYLHDTRVSIQNSTYVVNGGDTDSFVDAGWVFFAVTVDSTAINATTGAKIYYGSETEAIAQVANSGTSGSGGFSTMAMGDSNSIVLANSINFGTSGTNRSIIDTYLSDIRVYGSTSGSSGALDSTAIEAIRASAIPESSTTTLILAGGALVALFAFKRKRR